jgi:hypothetical protein
MEYKYVIELKMLAIMLVTSIINLQTHTYLFSILISIFREHSMDLFQSKIQLEQALV